MKIVLGVLACLIVCVLIARTFIVRTDLASAKRIAQHLISDAGGVDTVCKQADQIFQRYGTTTQTFFTKDLLKEYPALASIGKVDYIMPGNPPYIKIRVGTHLDGYILRIQHASSIATPVQNRHIIEVEKNRIYISR